MSYDWRWLRPEEAAEQGLNGEQYAYAQTVVPEGTIRVPISHELVGSWGGLAHELQVLFADGHAELKGEGHD